MSSFFRNPNDVTETEDQTETSEASEASESFEESEAGGNDAVISPRTPGLQRVRTLDTTSSTNAGALSRQLTRDAGGGNQETSEWIVRALLEEKCLNDAVSDFQKRNKGGRVYTKDDPEVQALARAKYEYMSETLGKLEVLPPGPERRDSAALAVKKQVRDGLDMLSGQSPQPDRPGLLHRDASLLSVHSGIRDLVLSDPSRSNKAGQFYQQHPNMNQSMDAIMGLPPVLRPLVDHPMFELSRYQRDFKEIRMIGKGGYGKVYHVQHRLDGSNYAVKKISLTSHRLKRIQDRGQAELDSLFNELRMLAKFDHPNIVRYYNGWLEYTTQTPFPSPAPNGKLMLEAPPAVSEDASAGAQRTDDSFDGAHFRGYIDSESVREKSMNGFDIMFERSGGEILGDLDDLDEQDDLLAELQPQIKTIRRRRGSASTTGSAKSKLSSVHSIGPEDEDADGSALDDHALQRISTRTASDSSDPSGMLFSGEFEDSLPKPEAPSVLTLHIQMSLHPCSLAEYLSQQAPISPGDATSGSLPSRHCFHTQSSLSILRSILDGVEYLHSCGVVHRDLKPSNIFLSINPTRSPACVDLSRCKDCSGEQAPVGFLSLRIGDFGLVTEIACGHTVSPTAGRAVGTELYRPLHPSSATSEKLDVYALGIILVELLCPFGTRMERQQRLMDVRNGKVDAFLVEGDTGRLSGLVRGMTAADETARLSCLEVRVCLEEMLG